MKKWIWQWIDFLCYLFALIVLDVTMFLTTSIFISGLVTALSLAVLGFLFSLVGGKGGD